MHPIQFVFIQIPALLLIKNTSFIHLCLKGQKVQPDNKLELQLVLSVALALAFEANPDIRFSIYGHRVKQERVEIVRFHEPGKRLEIKKLFSQEGMYVNAMVSLSIMLRRNSGLPHRINYCL